MDFSENISEVGVASFSKFLKLFSLIINIIGARFKHAAHTLYYPPAGDSLVPIARDVIILLCTRFLFKKTIFHFHASGLIDGYKKVPALFKPLFRLAYNSPDLALTLSESQPPLAEFLKSKQSVVLPNGIPDNAHDFKRNSINTTKRILFVGAVSESKGVQDILTAACILKENEQKFQFDIVGEFGNSEFEKTATRIVEDNQLKDQIVFHGLKKGPDKWQLYKECDIFCFPTYYENEGFPVVLLEALSFSMPIVVTNWRGCPDIVTEENGYIVDTKSPQALAKSLSELINDDNSLKALAERNRTRFLDHYTKDCFFHNLDIALGEVLNDDSTTKSKQ